MLLGLEPAHYVLWLLKTIKSAELEQSLLVLPLTHIERLIYYCTVLLRQGRGTELCAKVSVFLVKVHQNQVSCKSGFRIDGVARRRFAH
jgi:U3 small nucleolar RNA-associated protein 12